MIQRLFQNKTLEDTSDTRDVLFRELIQRNCAEHYECACRIASYIEFTFEKKISEEEKIYLTIHLKRLNMTDE